jgi:predicted  nucleic acid-binding Zn-ribbon protein
LDLKDKLQEVSDFFETYLLAKDKTISEQMKEIESMKKVISDMEKDIKALEEIVNTYGPKIFNIQQILDKTGYDSRFENLEKTISAIIKENKEFEKIIAWLKEKKVLLPDQNGKIKVNPLIKSLLSNQKVVKPVDLGKKI